MVSCHEDRPRFIPRKLPGVSPKMADWLTFKTGLIASVHSASHSGGLNWSQREFLDSQACQNYLTGILTILQRPTGLAKPILRSGVKQVVNLDPLGCWKNQVCDKTGITFMQLSVMEDEEKQFAIRTATVLLARC